jgi:hypothetical protein
MYSSPTDSFQAKITGKHILEVWNYQKIFSIEMLSPPVLLVAWKK